MVLSTLYHSEIETFLRSLTITNTLLFDYMKQRTLSRFSQEDIRIQANPYLVRLCGYYTTDDEMIRVTSLDTGSTIRFTKVNMQNHPRTRRYYSPGYAGYATLCAAYPNQKDLIKSIVCPPQVNLDLWDRESRAYSHFLGNRVEQQTDTLGNVTVYADPIITIQHPISGLPVELTKNLLETDDDVEAAYRLPSTAYFELLDQIERTVPIAYQEDAIELVHGMIAPEFPAQQIVDAGNLVLVGYSTTTLRTRELQSVLNAITKTLTYIRNRWNVSEFAIEENYITAFQSMLWYVLHLVIYTQRFKNLKTPNVHPQSIVEYLKSNGLSSINADALSETQMWYLYRNLEALLAEKGSTQSLLRLIDGLLEGMQTTLKTKTVLQNTLDYATAVTKSPEVLSKDLTATTTPLEDRTGGTESVAEIIEREAELGLEPEYSDNVVATQEAWLNQSRTTRIPTKLIEIEKILINDYERFLYYEFTIHTAVYLWSRNCPLHTSTVELADLGITKAFTIGEIIACMHYMYAWISEDLSSRLQIPTVFNLRSVLRDTPAPLPDTVVLAELDPIPLQQIVDTTELTNVPKIISSISADDYIEQLDAQYDHLILWFTKAQSSADIPYYYAMHSFIVSMLQIGTLTLDGSNALIPGHTDYSIWMTDNPTIRTILEYYRETPAKRSQFLSLILQAAFPMIKSKYAGGYEAQFSQYELMRQLFTLMCSYNIAFLDSDLTENTYFPLKPLATITHSRVVSTTCNINGTQYAMLDDWVEDPSYG